MNYQDAEIFLTIVSTKSITKAAEQLFLSQPTISHRLNLLERELGVALIVRQKGHKVVQLTTKGEEFIAIAQRWVSLMKETQALKLSRENLHVSVGVTDSMNIAFMAPFYSKLLAECSPLELSIYTHYSSELYTLLESHEIDIAFVYHNLYYKNVQTEELFREKLYLLQGIPPTVPKTKVHTNDLNPDKEIFLTWNDAYTIWHDQWIKRMPRPRVSLDTIELALRMWNEPSLWMIAPASVVKEFCKQRPFYVSELENNPPARVCYKVNHKTPNMLTKKALDIFSKKLQEYIAQQDFDIPLGKLYLGSKK